MNIFDTIASLNPTPVTLITGGDRVPFYNTSDAQAYTATLSQLQAWVLDGGTVDPVFGDVSADTVSATTSISAPVITATTSFSSPAITENGLGVVSQADIGPAANKIPLNQTLGTLAFQDATFATVGQLQRDYAVRATNTAAQDFRTVFASQVGIDADTTLTSTVPAAGAEATVVIVTVGTTSRTVTFGTGFASTGTLATGTAADRRFVVRFLSDGTRLLEVSRTTAITV